MAKRTAARRQTQRTTARTNAKKKPAKRSGQLSRAEIAALPDEVWERLEPLLMKLLRICLFMNYHVIDVRGDEATPPHLTGVRSGHWVCWANYDTVPHDVTMSDGRWPFDGSAGTISLPACSPSQWYRVKNTAGGGKLYEYTMLNDGGPPDGPDMFVD